MTRTMKIVQGCCGVLLVLGATVAMLSQATSTAAQPAKQTPQSKTANVKAKAVHADAGERAFQTNCGRCHYAPQSLSPRITGTVVRHMRVRANLSAEDERLILSYLNP